MRAHESASTRVAVVTGGAQGIGRRTSVYAQKNGGGFARIVRVRIKDRVQEEVLSLKDFPQLVDPFTEWYGLTPDGKILLMRDSSVQEIYALDLAKK